MTRKAGLRVRLSSASRISSFSHRSQIRRAKEHGAGTALVERLFQLFLPGIPRDEMPFVQERLQLRFGAEPPGNTLDRVFVSAGVGGKTS